ncbi:hypothetical protein PBAT_13715 [Paenibacillus antarcticus]|uniref:SLH domain-containing protein n=1 Tax=Paenibacillus antarcticus TaxID=253703 RepID=A0A168MSI2_9BACL|nr:hypothetical protein PBAT_13715 [Paenibacillus antarcticus]
MKKVIRFKQLLSIFLSVSMLTGIPIGAVSADTDMVGSTELPIEAPGRGSSADNATEIDPGLETDPDNATAIDPETEIVPANAAAIDPVSEAEVNGNYTVSFTDESTRGGWKKATGNGMMTFTDGVGDAGFMTLAANGNTVVMDDTAPIMKDGFIQADITPLNNGGRMALLFRYQNGDSYAGISYDDKWGWCINSGNGWGTISGVGAVPAANVKTNMRVEFRGEHIRLLIDGVERYSGNIPQLDLAAGKIGVRFWGYDTGATQANVKIDNFTVGELSSLPPQPDLPVVETDANGNYTVSFTDAKTRGGWTKTGANGAMIFTDGAGDAGNMQLTANGASQFADLNAPSQGDGFVEMDVNNLSEGRIALLFRYQNESQFAGVGYDVGTGWKFLNNGNDSITFQGAGLPLNKKTRVRIEYKGENIRVIVAGTELYSGNVPGLQTGAGKIGVRVWGYGTGATQGTAKFDNITTGALHETEMDEHGNYKITFTDRNKRGGFQKVGGDGTVEFIDGVGDAGYMKIAKQDNSESKVTYMAISAPLVQDGFIEMDATNLSDGRIGFLFRQQNASKYAAVAYDVGTWKVLKDGQDVLTNITGPSWKNGDKIHVRIEYAGDRVTLLVNGAQVFSQKHAQLADMNAGQVGLIAWGYGTGGSQGKMKVDNIVVGAYDRVTLTPDNKFVLYAEAGSYDVPIALSQTNNALVSIEANDVKLTENTDYSVSNNTITLKKEYVSSVKEAGGAVLTFAFADGFETNFELSVQAKPNDTQINYVRDFSANIDELKLVSGMGTLTYDATNHGAKFVNSSSAFIIDHNAPELKNSDVEFTFQPANDNGNFALVTRYRGSDDWVAIGINGASGNRSTWTVWNGRGGSQKLIEDGDRFYAKRLAPYTVRIRVVEKVLTIWVDGGEVYSGEVDLLTGAAGKAGIRLTGGAGALITNLSITSADLPAMEEDPGDARTIQSGDLVVNMDSLFPRVIDYKLNSTSVTMKGQERPYYVVELNNKEYRPQVTADFTSDTASYHMTVEIEPSKTVTFDVIFTVVNNVLQMKITNIKDTMNPIYSFNFPRHSLVSLSNEQPGAELRENRYGNADGSNYTESIVDLKGQREHNAYATSAIVVISDENIAATINNGSINNRRGIAYQTFQVGSHYSTGLWSNGYQYRGLDNKVIEEPWVKVAITGDRNQDGKVDFQDGAIARRDDVLKDGETADMQHSSAVMSSLNTIAMDVGSAAQYPFLRILDNIKKVSLGTDSFPQNIVIKGYNGQGHDSNNGDFTNYNQAAGGLNDFNVLLEKAQQYNTTIGIHINQTETYPESITFGKLATKIGGWPWYDVASQIVRENDILDTDNGMIARLDQLNQDTKGNLSLIYVDVYFGSRWPMYSIIDKINSMGMAIATEYPREMDTHSVWAHHVGGEFNNAGSLVRFVNHTRQDVFGSSSLFRSSGDRNNLGINGWQTSYNYASTIEQFFTQVLPNRYLVQFPIMQFDTENRAVLGEKLEIVTEYNNGKNTIRKDNHLIADGNLIFIPWDVKTEEKIYHWNPNGGASTWTLPASWNGYDSVVMYELSDHGRSTPVDVSLDGAHKVTIHAKAKTGYVIYPKSKAPDVTDMAAYSWSEGSLVKDMGFDSFTPEYAWKFSSSAGTKDHVKFENNNRGNTYLTVRGVNDATITQEIKGLEPGKTYAASIWAEVSNGRTATLAVRLPNGTEVSNEMDRSNIIYGLHHTDKYKRNIQRMKVHFTATTEGTATLILKAAVGADASSYVLFDDARIVLNAQSDQKGHYLYEDFENVDEGYGVFLATESDQTHLAESNAPHTFDTIDGRYSLKTRGGDYLRTAPYTLRLKPNTRYEAGLDYRASTNGAFTVAVKSDKAQEAGDTTNAKLASEVAGSNTSWGKGSIRLSFTTGPHDDYYIDITKGNASEYSVDNFYVDEFLIIDRTILQNLYDANKDLIAEKYTAESYATLTAQLIEAKTILDKAEVSEEEIISAYDALKAAQDALIAYAEAEDISRLQLVINEMKALPAGEYKHDEKWTVFQGIINEADTMTRKDKVTVPEVNAMINQLFVAKNELSSLVNKSELQKLYDISNTISSNDVVDGKELQDFLMARTTAKTVIETSGQTQEQVDAAFKELQESYSKIVPKKEATIWTTLENTNSFAALAQPDWFENCAQADALAAAIAAANKATTWKEVNDAISDLNAALDSRKESDILIADNMIGGTLEQDRNTAKAGDIVTLTAHPSEGGHIVEVIVTSNGVPLEVTRGLDGNYTFRMPGNDVTVSAKFNNETPVNMFIISGTLKRISDINVSSAVQGWTVKVMNGKTQLGDEVITDVDGAFAIKGIPNGTYNLVVSNGNQILTSYIKVAGANKEVHVTIPNATLSNMVEIQNGAPNIVVDGLNNQFTQEEIDAAKVPNNSIAIKLSVAIEEGNIADIQKIIAAATQKDITMFINLNLIKQVTTGGNAESAINMPNALQPITIYIPLTKAQQGKSGYVIYRVHNGQVEMITTDEVDGEKIVVMGDTIALTTKKFSTYAIGYDSAAGPSNPGTNPDSNPDHNSTVVPDTHYAIQVKQSEGGTISPKSANIIKGGSITFTITPDDRYQIVDVLVDGKSVGPVTTFTFSKVNAKHIIEAKFALQSIGIPYYEKDGRIIYIGFSADVNGKLKYISPDGVEVRFGENKKSFSDIGESWALKNIAFVTERELFQGTSKDKFSPQLNMTRGMFVTVIGRLYESSYGAIKVAPITFSDVSTDAFYASYAAWALENGIVSGVGNDQFVPNREITREEMAKIIFNFSKFLQNAPEVTSAIKLDYADVANISDYAREAVMYATLHNMMQGRNNNQFDPKGIANRAEVAAVIQRFVESMLKG